MKLGTVLVLVGISVALVVLELVWSAFPAIGAGVGLGYIIGTEAEHRRTRTKGCE